MKRWVEPELKVTVLAENPGSPNRVGPGLTEDSKNLTVEGLFEEHRNYVRLEVEGLCGRLVGKLNAGGVGSGIFIFGFCCHFNSMRGW